MYVVSIYLVCVLFQYNMSLYFVSDKYIIYMVDTIMINHYPLVNEHPESHQPLETEL